MNFTVKDYAFWARLLFHPDYPGYRKAGFEQPDSGEGSLYEYTHLSPKYIKQWREAGYEGKPGGDIRELAYAMLHSLVAEAQETAIALGIPPDFMPVMEDSTLRLLRYPPGAISKRHTDFDLFTKPLWRNTWDPYVVHNVEKGYNHKNQLHIGELTQKLLPHVEATAHEVRRHHSWQYSAAYFAMPSLSAVLPDGQRVGDWVAARKKETRYE